MRRTLSKIGSDTKVTMDVSFFGTFDLYHRGRPNLPSKQRTELIISTTEGNSFSNLSKLSSKKHSTPKGF